MRGRVAMMQDGEAGGADLQEIARQCLRFAAPKTAEMLEELGVDPVEGLGAAFEAACRLLAELDITYDPLPLVPPGS